MEAIRQAQHVHFIGIGGIGVSAIARMMLLEKKKVTGSDMAASPVTSELKKAGAKVMIGHKASQVDAADLVIYTVAISQDNPELKRARARGIPVMSYPQMLGLISAGKRTVAIAGTHGKTTTTAMIGKILSDSVYDPTIIVGSILKDRKTNLVVGKSDYLVVEADEYRRSFLNINPSIIVITNIDVDHLDYYKDLADIQHAFSEFVAKLPQDGVLVCNPQDPNVRPIALRAKCQVVDYTKANDSKPFALSVPGEHNQKNAHAAFAASEVLGARPSSIRTSLENFAGTWRRIEQKGTAKSGAIVYDDYAHGPAEVQASLAALRGLYPEKGIVVLFMPHLYSRTKLLMNDFAKSFGDADAVLVLDIYAAREKKDPEVHSKQLVDALVKEGVKAEYMKDKALAKKELLSGTDGDWVIVTMGAGDVYTVADDLVARPKKAAKKVSKKPSKRTPAKAKKKKLTRSKKRAKIKRK